MNSNPQSWTPSSAADIVGNYKLKKLFGTLLKRKKEFGQKGFPREYNTSILISGPSRSGKTATVKNFVRCLFCKYPDIEKQKPCGKCEGCQLSLLGEQNTGVFGDIGLFEYCPVDCSRHPTTATLEHDLYIDVLEKTVPRVNYLDEVHFLARRGNADFILKAVEERTALWILSTARLEEMDEMLEKRSLNLSTEPPSIDELASWTVERFREFGLTPNSEEIFDMSERNQFNPGVILKEIELKKLME